MDEATINQLRSDILGDDIPRRSTAIRCAIEYPHKTTALIADLYSLTCSDCPATAAYAWAAIRRYRKWAVPFLLRLMDSEDVHDRRNAIHLLLGLGHNRSSYLLERQILEDRPDVQPDWGEQRTLVVRKLIGALDDPDLNIRTIAAATLDDVGETPDSIVALLASGLESNDLYVQNLSALHLGRLAGAASAALPALINFAESNTDPSDGTFRPVLAAEKAIERIVST